MGVGQRTAPTEAAEARPINLLRALAPFLLIVVMVALFLAFDPVGGLRDVPPAEALSVDRVTFQPDLITLTVRNDGADPVRIAQVQLNGAFWSYAISDANLPRLGTATLTVSYPWEPGLPVEIVLVTSTGLTASHTVEAAALTPGVDGSTLAVYTLLGIYMGVVPVAIGLLWYPALRRAGPRSVTFFLALTLGLLAFLLVDTVAEGV
ncbi:MAG: metal transporter, partial [Nitriliruptorales bacterium]|nr:metal transporter [Nitriliruptorales bacterium]